MKNFFFIKISRKKEWKKVPLITWLEILRRPQFSQRGGDLHGYFVNYLINYCEIKCKFLINSLVFI